MGLGGCTPEPLLLRMLSGVLLSPWGDGEAAVCSSTSQLAEESVMRQCVHMSLSLLPFSLITISEVISDASLTVLSKQGGFSKLFAMSTKGNWLSLSPSSSKEDADVQQARGGRERRGCHWMPPVNLRWSSGPSSIPG